MYSKKRAKKLECGKKNNFFSAEAHVLSIAYRWLGEENTKKNMSHPENRDDSCT